MPITARDLDRWADNVEARHLLPALVRRLIHGTIGSIEHIDFPAYESIQGGGWDGELSVATGNAWVPAGLSGWECGCNKEQKGKADEDYRKRTTEIDPGRRAEQIFVFVTPRKWSKKAKWTEERRAEKEWRDVRVLDANDLEQWLEQAPVAAAWLAEQLGQSAVGLLSVEYAWGRWAEATEPRLSAGLVLAGREHLAEKLFQELKNASRQPLVVVGHARDEALAFICAVMQEHPEFGDRALIVESEAALTLIQQHAAGSVVVLADPRLQGQVGPLLARHQLIVAEAVDVQADAKTAIALGWIGPQAFREALGRLGVSSLQVERLARESGRHLSVLRRRLARLPALRQPPWANADSAKQLMPAVLAGAWRNRSGDRELLEQLADKPYAEIEQDMLHFAGMADAPVQRIGNDFALSARIDAWFAVRHLLDSTTRERFFAVVDRVMTTPDPKLELDKKDWYQANVLGKRRAHSGVLRRGLAEMLILLTLPEDSYRYVVDSHVRRWLQGVNAERWLSLGELLPYLAEAAPEVFLDALEHDLQQTTPAVTALFEPFPGLVHDHWPHVDLLWALECIAWLPEHFARAAYVLTDLCRYVVTGNVASRPDASLLSLLRSWMPMTNASLEARLGVMVHLAHKCPSVARRLCLRMTDPVGDIAVPTFRPKWRELRHMAGTYAPAHEHNAMLAAVKSHLLRGPLAPNSADDIISLIDRHNQFDAAVFWRAISDWAIGADDRERTKVRERIRRRALPADHEASDQAELVRSTYLALTPSDPVRRNCWLFDQWWIECACSDLDEYEKWTDVTLPTLRQRALVDLWEGGEATALLALAEMTGCPESIGWSLIAADLPGLNIADLMRQVFENGDEGWRLRFASRLVDAIPMEIRCSALKSISEVLETSIWIALLCRVEANKTVWQFVDGLEISRRQEYWRHVQLRYANRSAEDIGRIVSELLAVQRSLSALHVCEFAPKAVSTALLISLLENLPMDMTLELDVEPPKSWNMERVMAELAGRNELSLKQLAEFEFRLFPLLSDGRRGPQSLFAWLAESPEYFVDLVMRVFDRSDGRTDSTDWMIADPEYRRLIAGCSYDVLYHWTKALPGQRADGSIDSVAVTEWVLRARSLCREYGRAAIGDQQIGQVLAHLPADPEDAIWPHRVVRELLEQLDSENIAKGVRVGRFNARGITSRGPYDGGAQERELADKYEAEVQVVAIKWPRTAQLLRTLARFYRYDAASEDTDATWNLRED